MEIEITKSPKISIVIPSFNKEKYIGKTLRSIFSQTYKNFEVIIEDGDSTDKSLDIIRTFAKKYPKFILWESKKDKGQLSAINKGLKKSSGEILTYINADDVYAKNAFKKIVKAYTKNPKALWFAGQGIVINKKDREIAKSVTLYKNFLLSLNSKFCLLITNYLMQPSVFFTKKAYQKYGPFTGTKNFVMEYDFWLKLAGEKMPVLVPDVLSKFRIEPGTKTKNMSGKIMKEDFEIVKAYTKNPFILSLHKLHNLGRLLIEKFV